MDTPTTGGAPSRALVIAVLTALLLGGILGGIAIDRTLLLGHGGRPPRGMMMGGPGDHGGPGGRGGRPMDESHRAEMREHMVERLDRALDLTPEQKTKVADMLPRHMAAFDSLRQAMAPQLKALLDSSAAEMEAILTPDQVQKWRKMRRPGPPMP